MAEEKRSLLQHPPEPGPRPEPEFTEQTRVGIPQPDGSVLFVTPPTSLDSGGPPGARGGSGASGFGPAPAPIRAEQYGDEQPRAKPPLPPSQVYDAAPGFRGHSDYLAPAPGHGGYLAPAPGHGGYMAPAPGHSGYLAPAPGHMTDPGAYRHEKPTAGPAPGVLSGEGAGFRPPPSQAMPYDRGASLPPKSQLPEPSRAPERSYSLAASPNPPQQFYPSFQHQAYQPYQPPPSFQQQPYQQPMPGQPPFPQHPYRSYQPVAARPPFPQHPYQQVPGHFPAVRYQHPPPAQAVAQQPPPPPKRVKTSLKFDAKTVDDNQYYLSICLFILVCVFCNPIPLLCAIPGFLAAKTAATANEGGDLQKAQQHHKRAQFFNLGAAVTLIGTGVIFLTTIFVAAYIGAIASSN